MTPPELLGAGVGPGSVAGTNIEPLSSSSSENLPPGVNNNNNNNGFFNSPGGVATPTPRGGGGNQPFGVLTPNPTLPEGHPGANGAKYYTIQRVNGNGGNGKADGVGGGHRHTLEESDRVKKNSVQRYLLKQEKDKKKAMVGYHIQLVLISGTRILGYICLSYMCIVSTYAGHDCHIPIDISKG